MGGLIGEVAPPALGIALSPFPIVPALFLLFTPRPRAAGGCFLAGWAGGIAAATALFTVLAGVIETREETPLWASWAKLGLGVVLVLAAVRQGRSGDGEDTPAWMRGLTDATPARALRLGLLLSTANPKVLLLSAAAGLTVGAAEPGPSRAVAVVCVFTAIAALTVALPLLLHLTAGERVLVPLSRARQWLVDHNSTVTAVVLALIGVLLAADGASGL